MSTRKRLFATTSAAVAGLVFCVQAGAQVDAGGQVQKQAQGTVQGAGDAAGQVQGQVDGQAEGAAQATGQAGAEGAGKVTGQAGSEGAAKVTGQAGAEGAGKVTGQAGADAQADVQKAVTDQPAGRAATNVEGQVQGQAGKAAGQVEGQVEGNVRGNVDAQVPGQDAAGRVRTQVEGRADVRNRTDVEGQIEGRTQGQIEGRTRGQIEGQVEGRTNDLDARLRGDADARLQDDVDARLRGDADARLRGDADLRGDLGADADADVDLGWDFDASAGDQITISTIEQGSLAARAGLQTGDRILQVNNRRFTTQAELNAYLRNQAQGRIPILVERNGRRQTLYVNIDAQANRGSAWARNDWGWNLGLSGRDRIIVNQIIDGTLAARAGLRAGDQILFVDGQRFTSQAQLNTYLRTQAQGRIPIVVSRNGQRQTLYVSVDERFQGRYEDRGYRQDQRFGYDGRMNARPGLGVTLTDGSEGVWVKYVYRNSPAFHAGLQPGDYLVSLNGRSYCSTQTAIQAIREMRPGEELAIQVRRDGQLHMINAQLDSYDTAMAGAQISAEQYAQLNIDHQRQTVMRPNLDMMAELEQMRAELRMIRQKVERLEGTVDAGTDTQRPGQPFDPETDVPGDDSLPELPNTNPDQPNQPNPDQPDQPDFDRPDNDQPGSNQGQPRPPAGSQRPDDSGDSQ